MKNRSRAHPAVTPDGATRWKWTNRIGWRIGIAIIAPAAAGIVAWSLYVVAHDMYGVPRFLAALVAACFDGVALACLYLASEAVREGRSALGPRLVTLLQAAISMYLNYLHAEHINGGTGATLMFAAPTAGLLLLFDQSWAATRARHRIARGERPMRWPVFGWLGWLLAGEQAWQATKQRAVEHVTGKSSEDEPTPAGAREPNELLASELADMPPSKAIRIMHEARPELTLAELAEVLRQYGQEVTELDVAIVLDRMPRPSDFTLTRANANAHHYDAPPPQQLIITVQQPEALPSAQAPNTPPAQPQQPEAEAPDPAGQPTGSEQQPGLDEKRRTDRIIDDALAVSGLSTAAAVRRVRDALPGLNAGQIAEQLSRRGFEKVTDSYVRTVNSRDRKTTPKSAPAPRRPSAGPYL
ncbi:DUF2637 domain-containing protein [Streptomyces violaceusniger]|uniref:DUF2637 domain-containing protein n=1 Tax=Streptomyces violaceusniger TaxID=68280 RepID=UPI000996CB5F|nr:DUF2637 domain-containing protein [Streptomyces hygroscopicus]AQW55271.1 hypothetical protein SHXM_08734 [Streptomyces hygroscopicus]